MTKANCRDCSVEQEFAEVDFGDERLVRRFLLTAKRLMASPETNLNQALRTKFPDAPEIV